MMLGDNSCPCYQRRNDARSTEPNSIKGLYRDCVSLSVLEWETAAIGVCKVPFSVSLLDTTMEVREYLDDYSTMAK